VVDFQRLQGVAQQKRIKHLKSQIAHKLRNLQKTQQIPSARVQAGQQYLENYQHLSQFLADNFTAAEIAVLRANKPEFQHFFNVSSKMYDVLMQAVLSSKAKR